MINQLYEKVINGGSITFNEALQLAQCENKTELYDAANNIRKHFGGNFLELCSIVNAKSGRCSEDCKFCAQSSHYDVPIEEYELVEAQKAVNLAKENNAYKVHKFSLVTSGKSTSMRNIDKLGLIYQQIAEQTELELCASMGLLTEEKALKIKSFGVKNYHCNLETGRSYFPNVCTTHTYEQKIETIRLAQKVGMLVCSGGIIGLGESMTDRIEMALELNQLGIKSIPINILNPIEGTPFAKNEMLTIDEILTTIAIFRFTNPHAYIRFAGGRALLGEHQNRALNAGINAAMVGNYLTTIGNNVEEDLINFEKAGFHF